MSEQPEYGKDGSDLRTIEQIFTKAQVGFTVDDAVEDKTWPTVRWVLTTAGAIADVEIMTKANEGYLGFYTGMGFDEDGALLWVGAWE